MTSCWVPARRSPLTGLTADRTGSTDEGRRGGCPAGVRRV